MQLLINELKIQKLKILLFLALIIFILFNLKGSQINQIVTIVEKIFVIFPAAACCLLFSNNEEVELVLTYKMKKTKIFFAKFFVILFSALVIGLAGEAVSFKSEYLFSILLSFLVTCLFILSLSILLRLTIRNNYGSVGTLIFLYSLFQYFSEVIRKKVIPIWFAHFDPYITCYMINTDIWYRNKILFSTVSVVFLMICYALLRKERIFNI